MNRRMTDLFFTYDGEGGFESFKTEAEAIKRAEEILQDHRDNSGEGWADDEVTSIVYGSITKRATMCDVQPWPLDDEDEGQPEFDYSCNYKFMTPEEAEAERIKNADKV